MQHTGLDRIFIVDLSVTVPVRTLPDHMLIRISIICGLVRRFELVNSGEISQADDGGRPFMRAFSLSLQLLDGSTASAFEGLCGQ